MILVSALLEKFRRQAGPAGLMARTDAGAVIAVKVFVEEHEVSPVRVALEGL